MVQATGFAEQYLAGTQAPPEPGFSAQYLARTTPKTFGTAFSEIGGEQLPFVGVGFTALKLYPLIQAAKAMEVGAATPEQEQELTSFALDSQRPQTLGYTVGKVIADAPGFIAEFLTGASLGTAAAKKLGGKAIREFLEKLATEKGLKAAAKQLAVGTLPTLAGMEATQAAATVLTPGLPTATRSTVSAQNLRLPPIGVQEGPGGELKPVLGGPVKSFAEALPKGVLDQAIEVASELSGGVIHEAGIALGLGKVQKMVLGRLAEKLGSNREALAQVTKHGWDGPVAEWLEEVVGHGMRKAVGLPTQAPGLPELIAFSILGAGFGAAQQAGVLPSEPQETFTRPGATKGTAPSLSQEQAAPAGQELPGNGSKAEAGAASPTEGGAVVEYQPQVSVGRGAPSLTSQALLTATRTEERASHAFPGGHAVDTDLPLAGELKGELAGEGMDLVVFRGSETAHEFPAAWLGPGVVGVSEEALRDSPEETSAVVRKHEPIHELATRLGDIDEVYKRLAAADLEGQQAVEKAYERDFLAAEEVRRAKAEAAGKPYTPRTLSETRRREEGVAHRAELLANYLDFIGTPDGKARLEAIARNDPPLLSRVVDAVVRTLRRVGIDLPEWQQRALRRLQRRLGEPGRPLSERDLESVRILHEALGALRGRKPLSTIPGMTIPQGGDVAAEHVAAMRGNRPTAASEVAALPPQTRGKIERAIGRARDLGAGGSPEQAGSPEPGEVVAPIGQRHPPPPQQRQAPSGKVAAIAEHLRSVAREQSRFMGNKREFLQKNARRAAKAIASAAPVETVFDMYSGGGAYGLSVARGIPSVRHVVVNEVDPTRRLRLEEAFTSGGSFLDEWQSNPVLQEVWRGLVSLRESSQSSSPSALAVDVVSGQAETTQAKYADFVALRDEYSSLPGRAKAAVVALRDVMFSGVKADMDRLLRTARADADALKAHYDALRSSGVSVEIASMDAVRQKAIDRVRRESPALVLLDPPYHESASGTYRVGGAEYRFDSPEFLGLNASAAAAMAPGNLIFYHNKATRAVRDSLSRTFGGNMTVSAWERQRRGSRAAGEELFGVYDGTTKGGAVGSDLEGGQPARAPRPAGVGPGVAQAVGGNVGEPTGRRAEGGGGRDRGAELEAQRDLERYQTAPEGAATRYSRPVPAREEQAREAFEEGGRFEGIPFAAAYHGSGADFDRFDSTKIGTGEGAQAFGYGHYFAGKREVAEFYKRKLSGRVVAEQSPEQQFAARNVVRSVLSGVFPGIGLEADPGTISWYLRNALEHIEDVASRTSGKAERLAAYQAANDGSVATIREMKASPRGTFGASGGEIEDAEVELAIGRIAHGIEEADLARVPSGRLYKVNLAPAEDEYLLWDEPLSKQSEKVKGALTPEALGLHVAHVGDHIAFVDAANHPYGNFQRGGTEEEFRSRWIARASEQTGAQLYRWLTTDQPRASALLLQAGIRGIKYRDGTSRHTGGDSFNYVIFDENDITIEEKFAARRLSKRQQAAFGTDDVSSDTSRFVQNWIDYFNPVNDVQQAIQDAGGTLTADVWQAEKLRRGRTGDAVRRFTDKYVKPLTEAIRSSGISMETAGDHFEYRHADERDAYVATINPSIPNGSGWDAARKAAHAALIQGKNLSAVEQRWDEAWKALRKLMVDYGLMKQADIDAMETQYKAYSPLRGFKDELLADQLGFGRGISLRGSEVQRALGRTSASQNPLLYLLADVEKTIIRGEKARVDAAAIDLFGNNPTTNVASLSVPHVTRRINPSTGLVEEMADPTFRNDPNVVPLRYQGENRYLTFAKSHEHLAPILKGEGIDYPPEFFGAINKATRTLAALSTRWNPFFPPYNLIRDFGQAVITTLAEHGLGRALKLSRAVMAEGYHYAKAFNWAKKNPNGTPSNPYQRAAQRYLRSGGEVTFLDLGGLEKARSELERMLQDPTAFTKTRDALASLMESYQGAAENITRLAAFDLSTKGGASDADAALLAKNLTTNFEQKGRYGAWLNTFYAFSTAGIGGSARLLTALGKGAYGKRVLAATVGGAVLIDAINAALSGDDDDGTSYYDNIPDWEKRNNLILMNPLSEHGAYIKVPLPYGFNVVHALGTQLGHVMRGAKTPEDLAGEMVSAGADAFNPLGGGTDVAEILTPTVLDPVVQAARNRAWHGGPIRPPFMDLDRRLPDSEKAYPSVNPLLQRFARLANAATGGSRFEPGLIDVSPETMEHLLSAYTGGLGGEASRLSKLPFIEAPEVSDIPLARRAYGTQRASRHRQRFADAKLKTGRVQMGYADAEDKGAFFDAYREELILGRGLDKIDRQVQKLRELQKRTTDEARKAELEAAMNRLYILGNTRAREVAAQ